MKTEAQESRRKLVELLEAKLGNERARELLRTPNPLLGYQAPRELMDADPLGLMRLTVLVSAMGTTSLAG